MIIYCDYYDNYEIELKFRSCYVLLMQRLKAIFALIWLFFITDVTMDKLTS